MAKRNYDRKAYVTKLDGFSQKLTTKEVMYELSKNGNVMYGNDWPHYLTTYDVEHLDKVIQKYTNLFVVSLNPDYESAKIAIVDKLRAQAEKVIIDATKEAERLRAIADSI